MLKLFVNRYIETKFDVAIGNWKVIACFSMKIIPKLLIFLNKQNRYKSIMNDTCVSIQWLGVKTDKVLVFLFILQTVHQIICNKTAQKKHRRNKKTFYFSHKKFNEECTV